MEIQTQDGVSCMSETITIEDVDEQFINDVLLLDGNEVRIVMEIEKSMLNFDCPVCASPPCEGNRGFLLDTGEYLYIAKCCGEFAICEVIGKDTGEDNGLETE